MRLCTMKYYLQFMTLYHIIQNILQNIIPNTTTARQYARFQFVFVQYYEILLLQNEFNSIILRHEFMGVSSFMNHEWPNGQI